MITLLQFHIILRTFTRCLPQKENLKLKGLVEKVIHLGISDHSLVFLTHKAQYYHNSPRVIETQHFKHFDKGKCLSDLNQLLWANVDLYSDPNDMWREWKEMFLGCVDKHAPLKLKRVRKK